MNWSILFTSLGLLLSVMGSLMVVEMPLKKISSAISGWEQPQIENLEQELKYIAWKARLLLVIGTFLQFAGTFRF